MRSLHVDGIGLCDYVSAWIVLAARYMYKNMKTRSAFVVTCSVHQGVQVNILWKPLFDSGIRINFALKSFKWTSSSSYAAVTVSIIGFSLYKTEPYIMPEDLLNAHEELDKIVDLSYGLTNPTDDDRFTLLCKLHNTYHDSEQLSSFIL
jgi:hypothetical protein